MRLLRKQESVNKRIMKLLKEMIELHDFTVELQSLTSELGTMELQTPVTKL